MDAIIPSGLVFDKTKAGMLFAIFGTVLIS
jgi:hypothetical protein